ncbi:hypothetical protein [Longimicrobium sp.]|uniref:hypothetical protein n=1 Tax=Longimicrobium sp. TaxID=2029185 RepID=UPI002E3714EC|nr:hypothetical protein [Longimicrobium sp.]HEX6039670.1 hypothetical protein [Longimicrobium sp.]
MIFSHDRLLRFARGGRIIVLDSARRPLAHFGVSTRTRTAEDQRHAIEFAKTPELLLRVDQLVNELDQAGYASPCVERVREAAAACRPAVPG